MHCISNGSIYISQLTHSLCGDTKQPQCVLHKNNFLNIACVCVYIYIYHHHTVQVARAQVQYLRQWLDEKAPPAQVAEGDATMCASRLSALVAE